MKSEAPTSFEEIVNSFFENPKGQKPDTKALAKLLRSQEPLPPHFRIELAEMLDSRLSDTLACNWTLKPFYIGRYDEAPAQRKKRAETDATIGREIDAAIKREKSVESAIQQMVDDAKPKKESALFGPSGEKLDWIGNGAECSAKPLIQKRRDGPSPRDSQSVRTKPTAKFSIAFVAVTAAKMGVNS